MMKDLGQLLPEGMQLTLDNTKALPFAGTESFYYVEKGRINLFFAKQLPDGRSGARYHVCTVGPGEIVSVDFGDKDERLLALGEQDTAVRIISIAELLDLYKQSSEAGKVVDHALGVWFSKIVKSLVGGSLLGQTGACILPDQTVSLTADTVFVTAPGSIVWVPLSPKIMYFDATGESTWGEGTYVPVTSSVWAKTTAACDVLGCTTAELKDPAACLQKFHRRCSRMLIERMHQTSLQENEHIDLKFKKNADDFSRKLEKFSFLLKKEKKQKVETEKYEPVVQAVKLVADALGQKIRILPDKGYSDDYDGIAEVARDANMRCRRIRLEADWYRHDIGNFCSFMDVGDDTSVPVALIRKGNVYTVINAVTLGITAVDDTNAGKILSDGMMLYKSLPDRALGLKDIFVFSLHNLKPEIGLYFLLTLLMAGFGLLLTKMTQIFYDEIIPQAAKTQMVSAAVLLFSAEIINIIFAVSQSFIQLRCQIIMGTSLDSAIWDRLLKLPVHFFRNYTSGDLAERSMMPNNILKVLFGGTIASVVSGIFALVYFVQMSFLNKKLAVTAVWLTLCIMAVTAIVCYMEYRHNKIVMKLNSRISGLLLQLVNGIAKLKITSAEQHAFGIWADKFYEVKEERYKEGKIQLVSDIIMPVFPLVSMMILFFIFPKAAKASAMSTGTFLAFLALFQTFQGSLIGMTSSLTESLMVVPMFEQCKPILEEVPEVNESKVSAAKLSGNIEVQHINFRYAPDLPFVLKDVSLSAHPGEFIAIVGGSGSGKSTLLRILLGFEKAETGTVFYDNQEINTLDITSVRRQMGVVLQTSTVVQGSIFENIVGDYNLSMDDAWRAARMVDLEQTINDMPMGMQTLIPAGGDTLSGGQRQRIVIARAIIRKPPILFFDEASSALDNKSQAVVSHSLESLHVTRIVIAHRLSTIIHADRIYVLQDGVMRESGTYEELMSNKSYFYQLASRQTI